MAPPFRQPSIVRLQVSAPGGERPRSGWKAPHPPSKVDEVRAYMETTTLTHEQIAARTGVSSSTISDWWAKHGWTRPPGSFPHRRPPEERTIKPWALASRLRMQAERLLEEIERADRVDPAALAEALRLTAEACDLRRHVRRSRQGVPPPPPPEPPAPHAPAAVRKTRREPPLPSPHLPPPPGEEPFKWTSVRREAALKAWKTRYAKMREARAKGKNDE
jgi:hypothetical protein